MLLKNELHLKKITSSILSVVALLTIAGGLVSCGTEAEEREDQVEEVESEDDDEEREED